MKTLDVYLQSWRIRLASAWIPAGARVLDIGCFQGELFQFLGDKLEMGIGLDPLARDEEAGNYRILSETFSEPLPFESSSFDCVVLLATLEHIRDKAPLARECRRLLPPGGRVIITVPGSLVDKIVDLLVASRLADGMSLDQHHAFDPSRTPDIFIPLGFEQEHHSRFQFGLNNLFVFRRTHD